MIIIQKELFHFAQSGDLLIENDHFTTLLSEKLKIPVSECQLLIDLAEEQGIIQQTKRKFARMKTLSFISL
jgi:hypothetical protein